MDQQDCCRLFYVVCRLTLKHTFVFISSICSVYLLKHLHHQGCAVNSYQLSSTPSLSYVFYTLFWLVMRVWLLSSKTRLCVFFKRLKRFDYACCSCIVLFVIFAAWMGAAYFPRMHHRPEEQEAVSVLDYFITLRASCSTVYCNWSCLWVCLFVGVCIYGSVTTITRNCVHRSSSNRVCR